MKKIGIEVGESFDIGKLDPVVQRALESAPQAAQKLMAWKLPTLARVANGWSMNTRHSGRVWQLLPEAGNYCATGTWCEYVVEDAIYPLNLGDESGKPLDGANKYTITFEKGATPPGGSRSGRSRSMTLTGSQVGNSLNRFAVSSWMPFTYNPDGSLDLYFQNEETPEGPRSELAPAAKKGPFGPQRRLGLFNPKSEALTGRWNPPPVTKSQDGLTVGVAQSIIRRHRPASLVAKQGRSLVQIPIVRFGSIAVIGSECPVLLLFLEEPRFFLQEVRRHVWKSARSRRGGIRQKPDMLTPFPNVRRWLKLPMSDQADAIHPLEASSSAILNGRGARVGIGRHPFSERRCQKNSRCR